MAIMLIRFVLGTVLFGLAACVTKPEINDRFRQIDRAWQLEYQRTEEEFRFRVVDANFEPTLLAVRKTFLDLGMPIQATSLERGMIIAENVAPNPLTRGEWLQVAEIENPRVKAIGGDLFALSDDPKDYTVTVKATVRPFKGRTIIVLDYVLDSPRYRRLGFVPSQHAPPTAVQLASVKFWAQLEKRLSEVKAPPPRRRTKQEVDA